MLLGRSGVVPLTTCFKCWFSECITRSILTVSPLEVRAELEGFLRRAATYRSKRIPPSGSEMRMVHAAHVSYETRLAAASPDLRAPALAASYVTTLYAAGDAARSGHNASWAAADGVTAGISAHQSLTLAQPTCR